MKILALCDIYLLESPNEKLQPLVIEEKIDVILLLGGLFSNKRDTNSNSSNALPNKKKNKKLETTSIPELNWLLIPILVIPDENDLQQTKLIKQIQGQETVWVRYIQNKGTIIDSWFIFGITESNETETTELLKSIEEYSKLAPENTILVYSGSKKLHFPMTHTIILPNKGKKPDSESFVVSVDSVKDNMVTIIDLDKKTLNSLLLQ